MSDYKYICSQTHRCPGQCYHKGEHESQSSRFAIVSCGKFQCTVLGERKVGICISDFKYYVKNAKYNNDKSHE